MSSDEHAAKKSILNLYGLFGVSLILCVLPFVSAAILCVMFFVILLVAAYYMRGKSEEHSLLHNHTTHIIRTIWIGGLVASASTVCASFYMLANIDYQPFEPCASNLQLVGIEQMGFTDLYNVIESCVDDFISVNRTVLIVAVMIAALAPLGYMGYRFIKGAARAMKGYRLANPKSWL